MLGVFEKQQGGPVAGMVSKERTGDEIGKVMEDQVLSGLADNY